MASQLPSFPPMVNNKVLMAIKERQPDKVPVWIMRQTGHHLPEFRTMCREYGYLRICHEPELAKKATMMPMERFDFDAAMVFSNMFNVPEALGMEVLMAPKPMFPDRLTLNCIDMLEKGQAISKLKHVAETITMVRKELNGTATMFGFSGAPWTLMSYMIEGSSSDKYSDAKKWLYMYPEQSHKLLNILTDVVADFCILQAKAGAQVIQIYDHNARYLSKPIYTEFALPGLKAIRDKVRAGLEEYQLDVPMGIYTMTERCLPELAEAGYDLISLDSTVDPAYICSGVLPKDKCLQGNLDPCALYGEPEGIRKRVHTLLKKFRGSRIIANLGQAIHKDIPVENVTAYVDAVRSFKF